MGEVAPGPPSTARATFAAGWTLPEIPLRRDLRRRQLDGLLFRRQHHLGPYVIAFCSKPCRAVEVDGAAHDEASRVARDERRDPWLARQNVLSTVAAAATSTAQRAVPLLRDAEGDQPRPTAQTLP